MKDLTTTEAVLAVFERDGVEPNYQSNAPDGMGCIHYDHGCLGCRENTETATYLAGCVRLRQAFYEADMSRSGNSENDPFTAGRDSLIEDLHDAIKRGQVKDSSWA